MAVTKLLIAERGEVTVRIAPAAAAFGLAAIAAALVNRIRALVRQVRRLVQRLTGRGLTAAERAESEAKSSARKYWRRRVAEGQRRDDPDERPTREDAEAQKSAKKYWEREVADEQERRGTPDPPGKR